jgi:phosphatidylinositol alpha-mannosyltransferase
MQPLRILMVTQSYPPARGGVAEHAWHLARELARRGHEVTVLTGWAPGSGGAAPGSAECPGVRVLRRGRTVRIRANGATACLTLPAPGWTEDLPPWDLVHVQAPLEPILPLLALRRLEGPFVGTFHSCGRHAWPYRLTRRLLRPLHEKLAVRIAVSAAAEAFVARHFPGPYVRVPNGVDPARFRASPPRDLDPPRFLFVGRLDPRKGVGVLLEASRILSENRPHELVIAGDGPLRRRLERKARRLRVAARFLGAVPPSELPAVYAACHVLVSPALYGESFGIVLLEALASARAVVASDLPGYREVLAQGRWGLLVPPGDPVALARAMRRAVREENLARAWRDGARAVSGYAWPAVAERIEALYAGLLEGRGQAARVASAWPT